MVGSEHVFVCFLNLMLKPRVFSSCLTFWWYRGGFFSECFMVLWTQRDPWRLLEPPQSCSRWRRADGAMFFLFYGLVSYDPDMAACLYLEVLGSWWGFCYCKCLMSDTKRCCCHQPIVYLHSPLASCLPLSLLQWSKLRCATQNTKGTSEVHHRTLQEQQL